MIRLAHVVFTTDVHIPGVPDYKPFIDPAKFAVDLFLDREAGLVWAVSRRADLPDEKRTRCYSVTQVREALPLTVPKEITKMLLDEAPIAAPAAPKAKPPAPKVLA